MTKPGLFAKEVALTVALGLGATSAFAGKLTVASRVGDYTSASTSLIAVPLDDSSTTSLSFSTTKANELVRMTYNAKCGVIGTSQSWVTVEITVDGGPTKPDPGTLFALCTATSPTSYVFVGAVRQSLVRVPTPGTHSIQVLAAGENNATGFKLGDTSLVVDSE